MVTLIKWELTEGRKENDNNKQQQQRRVYRVLLKFSVSQNDRRKTVLVNKKEDRCRVYVFVPQCQCDPKRQRKV